MDYWREYFRNANANIFEIIEGAIMLAASDCPKEFKLRRDRIAQILFSCRSIKCSNCDHHDHDGDDDDDGKSNLATDGNGNCSKERSKVINCSINDDDHDDDEEEESQIFNEVLRIKQIVDHNPDESASVLCDSLRKLQLMSISVEILKATEIGKSVNVLRKHKSKDVREIARTLIELWKDMVHELVNATTKITVSENTPEPTNPHVVDEEEGLPSPPLDDLAFLNPHSMALGLSEKFFDDVDDNGNPRKNENRSNGRTRVERHDEPKWKQEKPLNKPTVVPKPDVVKPCKPTVVDSTPGRRVKPNDDRKIQNAQKPVLSKKPVLPQECRPTSKETVQDKLEATKRKLQEMYQQIEEAKKRRTIQVMELHDLPKQGVALKNRRSKLGNNRYQHRSSRRF